MYIYIYVYHWYINLDEFLRLVVHDKYRKNPKHLDNPKNAVIILKLEQYHFTTEQ